MKLFSHVKVDLIAPDELQMPDNYRIKMEENGFEVRSFDSIESYLAQGEISTMWYFTRPQLSGWGAGPPEGRHASCFHHLQKRVHGQAQAGNQILSSPSRHKLHPTIPTFLDNTPLNAWERQSINGMYVRICLLSLIAGQTGFDYVPPKQVAVGEEEDYIVEVDLSKHPVKEKMVSEGVHPIKNGIVIDHICRGDSPSDIRDHMRLISRVLHLDEAKGGEWVSCGHKAEKSIPTKELFSVLMRGSWNGRI